MRKLDSFETEYKRKLGQEKYEMAWIRTVTGKNFHLFDRDQQPICIEDIAHSLSNLCRFAGHTRSFYSVADFLAQEKQDPRLVLSGLLHDASEAYLVDIPKPIKPLLGGYKAFEIRIMRAVYFHFGLRFPFNDSQHERIVNADMVILATEARDLMGNPKDWSAIKKYTALNHPITPIAPEAAKRTFLQYFEALSSDATRMEANEAGGRK